MKLDNTLLKSSLVFGLFIAVMVWLSLLTQNNSKHNQTLTMLNNRIYSNESTINYQRLNEKLAELSALVDSVQNKNNEWVMQTQLTEVQDELRNRIQLVSKQFDSTASYEQLQKLQQEVTAQLAIEKEQLEKLLIEIAQITNNASVQHTSKPTTVNKTKTKAQIAPFIIQGKEMRAGQLVISVLPIQQKNIEAAVLLAIGQSFSAWQLLAIDEHSALFQVGSQQRRLTIHGR